MIGFPRLGSHGRLGNQLWQIMSTIGIAEKHGTQAVFPFWKYEQFFQSPLPHGSVKAPETKEQHFHYHQWPITDTANLLGWLQSEKYFPSNAKDIFRFKESFKDQVRSRVKNVFDKQVIAIQVRRGDYVGNPNYYQIPVTWYINTLLEYFPNWRDYNIIFFSDDLGYCRTHFECLPNAIFADGLNDIQQLCLASLCDHFIIPNSTFSWWSAWLGEKPHSKIIHCGHLFDGNLKLQKDERDYYPERWISNDIGDKRIPLKDVTFTIPVQYDHSDRKANLELSLCMLQKHFDSNFIIGEKGNKFEYTGQWAKYVQFDLQDFHRTKMLNDMAMMAETPYIVNFDCDIFIPPMQIYLATELLRNGGEMVYPYDGRFARMERVWFAKVEKVFDIGVVSDSPIDRRNKKESVGGCVMWNKESFIEYGMENEYMVSYAPEDCERYDRAQMLGCKIERVTGTLYHMDHFKGPDSHSRNPFFRTSKEILMKIRKMSRDQLREYVDTWPWRHKYTGKYYSRISEGAIRSAKEIYKALKFEGSVIDVGCGIGEWSNDNPQYWGLDYGVRKEQLIFPKERYVDCNLEGIIQYTFGNKFDLCLCLEVAEHIKEEYADQLINYLCSLSDTILFSAAIPYQGGLGHVNEQWQTYWAEKFYQHGFGAAEVKPDIRDNTEIEFWYRQNIVLYKRGAKGKVEDFVLPGYYYQIVKNLHYDAA